MENYLNYQNQNIISNPLAVPTKLNDNGKDCRCCQKINQVIKLNTNHKDANRISN